MKTESHKKFSTDGLQKGTQQLLTNCLSKKEEISTFNKDLCQMMLKCNIPIYNFEVPEFQIFFKKYYVQNLVSRRTICRTYIPQLYTERMIHIREIIKNKFIWFAVDETTDSVGRYIANLIVGVLDGTPSQCYLVAVNKLEKTNNVTIARFVNESFTRLYLPEAVPSDKILIMVSDAATYMLKAAQHLKIFYENLIHVTCIAHGTNRVAEVIRLQYPDVNKLINNGKKIFLKAPLRVQTYREILPNIPLPPQPVITRWGTWIQAALFYADNYNAFKDMVESFPTESAESIATCQNIFKKTDLISQLTHIKTYFSRIPTIIEKLETRNLLLSETIKIVDTLNDDLKMCTTAVGKSVYKKYVDTIKKNVGFTIIKNIHAVMEGKLADGELPPNINKPNILPMFKYAPVTSCDVERSFSKYKNLLNENRQSFCIENVEKHMIVYCNENDSV